MKNKTTSTELECRHSIFIAWLVYIVDAEPYRFQLRHYHTVSNEISKLSFALFYARKQEELAAMPWYKRIFAV